MRYISIIVVIITLFISTLSAIGPSYTDYDISLYFEVTEMAIDQFVKTQVFPQPVGTYTDGNDQYSYSISLIQPGVTISTGSFTFSSAIIASVTLLNNTVKYTYPINVTVDIPTEDITVNEISGFLDDIPTTITNSGIGPQWLRTIIITAYENLEISIYPDQFLDEVNAQIPSELDIIVDDLEFGWEAISEKIRFNITIPTHAREKFVFMKFIVYDDPYDCDLRFKFYSNVDLDILGYKLWYAMTTAYPAVNNPEISLTPNTWSGQIVIEDNSGHVDAGGYQLFIYFGSSYGWIGVRYNFSYWGYDEIWSDPISPSNEL